MCSGSKSKLCPFDLEMETGFQDDKNGILHTNLLDLAATDNLSGFIHEVEEKGCDLNKASFWYGKSFGSKKMAMEERTPIMIASLYGSTNVLNYIISTGLVDPNRACGSDGATALHCAAAGGSPSSADAAKILIDASGDIHALDSNGKKPSDVIAPCVKPSFNSKRRSLEMLLNGINGIDSDFPEVEEEEEGRVEKKEYPVDVSMPDINEGVYGSAEFRMYSFKVKPCSRAYSHDWTECPFVHPGENARRRDPKKYHYSCVPCPDFKKGACIKGDSCEYAHGVFESWLHPAQYRTRLCKDETGCSRKVCFFAHKHEELRPLYASTGSAMPSPKPVPVELSPSPPMSPSVVNCSSPMWMQNKMASLSTPPPSLQLPGSRLKSALSARDVEFNMELLGLERIRTQQQQRQLVEEMAGLSSSPYRDFIKPTNLEDVFGSLDPSLLFSPKINNNTSNTSSPTGFQIRQNANQLRASYPSNGASYGGFDSSAAVAAAVMNSRSTAFSKRSQSFVDRSGGGYNNRVGFAGSPKSPGPLMNSNSLSDWSSPDGRLDWGFSGDDANKLRKSASFGLRSGAPVATGMGRPELDGSDGLWVQSMVRDGSGRGGPGHDMMPHWVDQMYMEQEQMVA